MNYQVQVERQRTAEATATAVAAIASFAGNAKRHEEFGASFDEHGIPFAAFLLIPEVRQLRVAKLNEVFAKSFCIQGQDRKAATEELLSLIGWEGALRALYDDLKVDGILRWDNEVLREVLDEGYAFIQTFDGCMVFDLAPIRAAIER